MKYYKRLLLFSVVFILTATNADAGSFTEKFRKFVLGPEAEAYSVNVNDTSHQPLLDEQSINCMSCHNGSRGRRIAAKNADAPYQARGVKTVDHPVGMDYSKYAVKKPWGYRAKHQLSKKIHLDGDRVTCLSCHRLKEKDNGKFAGLPTDPGGDTDCEASYELTVGTTPTELCLACHTK